MDILLISDILIKYFDGLFKPNKTTRDSLISKILDNESNMFLVNRKVINEYEESLMKRFGDNIDSLYPFLENIITNKSINVKSDSTEISNIYEDIEKSYLSDDKYMKSIIYTNISIFQTTSLKNQYSCIIENINKPNIHWLISELAISKNNSITIRYFDFKSNKEIENLFAYLFRLSNRHKQAYIYDRQTNFSHNLFDEIKDTYLVHYYTSYSMNNDKEKNETIKSNFNRVKIFKSINRNIHERRIIVKDLIIETDNDFWNINCDEPTWKIDITICESTSKILTKKNNLFKRDLR